MSAAAPLPQSPLEPAGPVAVPVANSPAQVPYVSLDSIDNLPLAYLECNVQGVITRCNKKAIETHSFEFGELVGRHIWALVAHDHQAASRNAFFAVMATGVNPPVAYRPLYTPNGGYRTFRFDRNVIFDSCGKPCGMRLFFIDVTERQLELERERQSRMWLESISDALNEAVIVTDALGFVSFVNSAAESMIGWSGAELKRMTLERGVPILSYTPTDGVALNHRMLLERHCTGIAIILNRNREQIKVHLSTNPVIDRAEGSTIGVVHVFNRLDGIL